MWAAWAGAAVSAVGAVIVLWVRWRDRPGVLWHFGLDALAVQSPSQYAELLRRDLPPFRVVRVTNVGDGSAYAVTTSGASEAVEAQLLRDDSGDVRGFSTPSIVGRVDPDEHLSVLAWVFAEQVTEDGSQIVQGDIAIRVEWTEGPVRHKRHRAQTLVLAGDKVGPHPPARLPARRGAGLASE